ncbi:MAG: hypothetical protein V4808_04430 [Pseudomonadota bacterium]
MKFKLLGGIAAAIFALATPGMASAQTVYLASDGLQIKGDDGNVDTVGWGTSQDDTVQFLSSGLGNPIGSDVNEECGAGPLGVVDFPGDTRLYFQAGSFIGWEIGEGSQMTSQNGVGIGITQSQLQAASTEMEGEETSIGYEWSADDFHGLLTSGDPDGKVTTIWSGTTCIMR